MILAKIDMHSGDKKFLNYIIIYIMLTYTDRAIYIYIKICDRNVLRRRLLRENENSTGRTRMTFFLAAIVTQLAKVLI